MTIADTLKSIFERGTENFNGGAFETFEYVLRERLEYYCPEIRTAKFYTDETFLHSRKDVLQYWGELHDKFDNEITSFEYLVVGKVSKIRCFYEKADFVLDVEMHFDEYGKVFKIINFLNTACSKSLVTA